MRAAQLVRPLIAGWVLFSLIGLEGCASGKPGAAKPAAEVGAAPTGEAAAGKWLLDEDGKEYRLEKLEKNPGHQRISETRLRTVWGVEVRIEREDDRYFYFRSYRTPTAEPVALPPEKDPRQVAAALATYATSLATVDEWTARGFDAGLPKTGQWRNGFEFADLNGDGALDLVHGPPRKTPNLSPMVFLGDGLGNWRRWRELDLPAAPYDYGDITVGDFDQDGRLDLALGIHQRGLLALRNEGDGKFALATVGLPFRWESGGVVGFSSRQVQFVDWDGDGHPELLALGEGPRMAGQGNTEFDKGAHGALLYRAVPAESGLRWELLATPQDDFFGEDLSIADVDGDGHQDFVAGSGTMDDKALFFKGSGESFSRVALSLLRPRSWVRSIAAGDFNGDGRTDLAATYQTWDTGLRRHGIDLLLQTATGGWERTPLWSEEGKSRGPLRVAAGDLDGDGSADLAAIGDSGQVWLFLRRSAGGRRSWAIEASPDISVEEGCAGYQLRLADLDGDGRAEIAASFAGEPTSLFKPTSCTSGGALRIWRLDPKRPSARAR